MQPIGSRLAVTIWMIRLIYDMLPSPILSIQVWQLDASERGNRLAANLVRWLRYRDR
jgi:hypothetical protein